METIYSERDFQVEEDLIDREPVEIRTIDGRGFEQQAPYTHYLPVNRKLRRADNALFHKGDSRIWNFLKMLGFDLRRRFDLRKVYDDMEGQEFGRRTFHCGESQEFLGRNRKRFTKTVQITRSMLSAHFRRSGRKFKIKDVDRTLLKLVRSGSPSVKRLQRKSYLNTLRLMHGTIGCPSKEPSTIALIETDDHNNTGDCSESAQLAMRVICCYLGEPLLLEVSLLNGGIHAYFQFDMLLEKQHLQKLSEFLEAKLTPLGLKCEIRTPTKCISLPGSACYEMIRITSYKRFMKGAPLSGKPFRNLSSAIKKIEAKYNEFKTAKFSRIVQSESSPIVSTPREAQKQKPFGGRIGFKGDDAGFTISEGDRFEPMRRLALSCARRGLSIDDFIAEIREHDEGSRDLAEWKERTLRRQAEGLFGWAEKVVSDTPLSARSDGFQSSIHLLDEKYKGQIALLAAEVSRLYLSERQIKYGKTRRKYPPAIETLLLEICGRILYEQEYGREIQQDSRANHGERMEYGVGYTFPIREFLQGLAEYHRLRVERIDKLFNFVIESSFFLTQYKTNEAGYSPGKIARQFVPTINPKAALLDWLEKAVEIAAKARDTMHLQLLRRKAIRHYYIKRFIHEMQSRTLLDPSRDALSSDALLQWSTKIASKEHGFSPLYLYEQLKPEDYEAAEAVRRDRKESKRRKNFPYILYIVFFLKLERRFGDRKSRYGDTTDPRYP